MSIYMLRNGGGSST